MFSGIYMWTAFTHGSHTLADLAPIVAQDLAVWTCGHVPAALQFYQNTHHCQITPFLIAASNGLIGSAPYNGIAEFLTKDYETCELFVMQIFGNPLSVAD